MSFVIELQRVRIYIEESKTSNLPNPKRFVYVFLIFLCFYEHTLIAKF